MPTTTTVTEQPSIQLAPAPQTRKEPLQLSGVLDQYKSFDGTPVIGREFPEVNLKEWFEAPNSDELLCDLAITSKQRKICCRVCL